MKSHSQEGVLDRVARERAQSIPTRWGAVIFRLKATVFQIQRTLRDWRGGPRRLPHRPVANFPVIAESRSALYSTHSAAEWTLQAGKVQNLRRAALALHGCTVAAGETFSFWANVGRTTRSRGFVRGRELREGCIVPNLGGGLCQLSNALYEAALLAGFEILERHPHSRPVPDSRFQGRDATVFWNYVDLRFRAAIAFQVGVELTADELRVRFLSEEKAPAGNGWPGNGEIAAGRMPESCETCGIADCFRHSEAASLLPSMGRAWLVDAVQPEFDEWMARTRGPRDHLILPMDSRRFRVGPYRWTTKGFLTIKQAPDLVLRRSWHSRRLASQGAARQRQLLAFDEALTRRYARLMPHLATHLVISQNLLPFLWREGVLGGRTFDVLMTRLPLIELEHRLDEAARHHPHSPTLADFRAPADLALAEQAALAAADRWITPHRAIAHLAGGRAQLLEWKRPVAAAVPRGRSVLFPASTLGRKGAYELREALRDLAMPVRLAGPILESSDFWNGFAVSRIGEHWLDDAAVVVLPAWVEHQPRRLLQALAAGIPVIASDACGLAEEPGVTIVPVGDGGRLREAIQAVLTGSTPASAAPSAPLSPA